jgi:pimeloyl-ACP methyl ester carboxylesterase
VTRLVLIPGLGADARLFEPQRRAFPSLYVPPWIDPHAGETLGAYASRLAEHVPHGRDVVLGGVSFGGMVAWEMAHVVQPAALLLVASCTSPAAIPRHHRWLARLAARSPSWIFRPPRYVHPLVAWAFGARSGAARAVIDHCLRTASPKFLKWGLSAIVSWRPSPAPPAPVVHVHGARDWLIPVSRVHATDVISDAGHLLNVTHSALLNERLQAIAQAQRTPDSLRDADTL